MFEKYARFDNLLVTGPQRSGTRICARMIAHDLGRQYIDENDLDMDSLYLLCSFLEKKQRYVIQCPCLCRYIHIFNRRDTAVILMRRDLEEIAASQKRIGWSREWLELAKYDRTEGVIAEVKYSFWENYQKKRTRHAFEINYDSLAAHPLWVAKDLRLNFKPEQTSTFKGNPDKILKTRPIRNRGIFCCDKRNTALLIKTNRPPKRINATGLFIWNLCDGTLAYRDILQKLIDHFSGVDEERAANDLDTFLNDLFDDDFLRPSPNDPAAPVNQTPANRS
ncbi:MAG: PqqD family protein [Candidatus Aminicenantes bacterium]|nr:PqqD family protein [Candidatus Aminicenantes bacterium]